MGEGWSGDGEMEERVVVAKQTSRLVKVAKPPELERR
jgi:hypothetical protein